MPDVVREIVFNPRHNDAQDNETGEAQQKTPPEAKFLHAIDPSHNTKKEGNRQNKIKKVIENNQGAPSKRKHDTLILQWVPIRLYMLEAGPESIKMP
jgi:hypothetical protein